MFDVISELYFVLLRRKGGSKTGVSHENVLRIILKKRFLSLRYSADFRSFVSISFRLARVEVSFKSTMFNYMKLVAIQKKIILFLRHHFNFFLYDHCMTCIFSMKGFSKTVFISEKFFGK